MYTTSISTKYHTNTKTKENHLHYIFIFVLIFPSYICLRYIYFLFFLEQTLQ